MITVEITRDFDALYGILREPEVYAALADDTSPEAKDAWLNPTGIYVLAREDGKAFAFFGFQRLGRGRYEMTPVLDPKEDIKLVSAATQMACDKMKDGGANVILMDSLTSRSDLLSIAETLGMRELFTRPHTSTKNRVIPMVRGFVLATEPEDMAKIEAAKDKTKVLDLSP